MPTRTVVATTAILLMAIGCSPSTPAPAPGTTLNIKLSNHLISIEFPGGSAEVSNGFFYKTETFSLGLKEDHLQVDGKDYGKVSKGDHVKVEKSGKVLINDVERKPTNGG